MNLKLHWKRPLLYLLLPVLLVLAFVGFPPPFAPPHRTRLFLEETHGASSSQEQSVPAHEQGPAA